LEKQNLPTYPHYVWKYSLTMSDAITKFFGNF